MSSSALFASSAGRTHSKNLVEFKAGKMTMKGKMVHPDKRKGLLYVYQSEDSLMHFCWKDRVAGSVEDDLIIFPDDCEFKRVDACTTGRVYVLKFKSSSRKLFFWLQESKTEKDEEYCKKVNEMLNSPPAAGASLSGGGTPDELQTLLGCMSQKQLMQLFGTFGPAGPSPQLASDMSDLIRRLNRSSGSGNGAASSGSSARTSATPDKTSTPATSESTKQSPSPSSSSSGSKPATSATPSTPQAPGGTILLSDLQRYLNNIRPVSTPGTPSSATVEVDLSDALLNAESIQGVLNDPSLVQELSHHLPDVDTDEADPERLRATLLSPQFQQGNMEEFVKALEKTNITPEKKSDEGTSSERSKDDKKEDEGDDKMNEG